MGKVFRPENSYLVFETDQCYVLVYSFNLAVEKIISRQVEIDKSFVLSVYSVNIGQLVI